MTAEAVPSAWTPSITGSGRLLPERWRVGGLERATMLRSVESLIVDDVTTIASALIAEGLDPFEALGRASALWRELVDDAVCRAYPVVLIGGAA